MHPTILPEFGVSKACCQDCAQKIWWGFAVIPAAEEILDQNTGIPEIFLQVFWRVRYSGVVEVISEQLVPNDKCCVC